MLTVYLDKNIYSYFLSTPIDPTYQRFLDYLNSNVSNFLVFYSYAHIEDLKQSSSTMIGQNLAIIEKIAKNNYCYYDSNKNKFCVGFYTPKEVFDCQEDLLPIIDKLIQLDGLDMFLTPEIKEQLEQLKKNWEKSEMNEKIDEKNLSLLDKVFPTDIAQLSINDLLRESYLKLREFSQNNSIYREFRSISNDTINKGKFTIDLEKIDFDKDLKGSPLQKSFLEYVRITLDKGENDEILRYDHHTAAYVGLDILGLNMDKKVKFNNLLVDANHSYFGAHFDYVVSNDHGFVIKSRALYKLLGISTKVLLPEEFLAEAFKAEISIENSETDFIKKLDFDVKNCLIKRHNVIGNKQELEYKIDHHYLSYFNTVVYITQFNTKKILFKKEDPIYLQNRVYAKIIIEITRKCINLFGIDSLGLGELKLDEEFKEPEKGYWTGRNWERNDCIINLRMVEKRLELSITYF
ncbi:hypothetical protein HF324_29255 [Chitinophaga oryzae]|uniref:Uncharacterized protein n=1 Tax=Chitinophaga oryzae TaxID=2725414 RepID=A0ABX6LNK7_9BACT|nr:hypothetical protein [Chitinophaga oryzae]QJB41714.1 hypothetical protein HF324_29255 [Chitinophaga oryzae]